MSKSQKPRKNTDSILHRDIKDLEIRKSLRRLGNVRVTEWELGDVLPAVTRRLAYMEVDIVGAIKRTANYRVMDWELKDLLRRRRGGGHAPSPEVMHELEERLRWFVGYVATKLIDHPDEAEVRTTRTSPVSLRIKLVLDARDAAVLIGHGGHTAAAIRAICKGVCHKHQVHVRFRILTHAEEAEEEAAVAAKSGF